MAVKVCDLEPCDRMQTALSRFLTKEQPPYNQDIGFVALNAMSKGRSTEPKRVTIRYCPFCGTRIGVGFLEFLEPAKPFNPTMTRRSPVNVGVR
jgi:hypothetical protein